MTECLDLEQVSNQNLVYSFIDELQKLDRGTKARELLTSSQRRSLIKNGILHESWGWKNSGLKITKYGRSLLEEALD